MLLQEKNLILGIVVAAVVLVLDQLTKLWIMNDVLSEQPGMELTSFFNLVYAWNTGVSFSMFDNPGAAGTIVLCLVAAVIVAALLWWLHKEKIRALQIGLGMIIGGALGNLIDRVRLGAVFDFLDFHIGPHHWPAFNVADSFICIGAAVIILHSILYPEKKENKEQK